MMRKLLFFIAFLFFISKISAFGTNLFYAEFTLTSTDFGTGAQFPCKVWFNGGTGEMRIDYSDTSGTVFMRQYYNYGNDIRYSVCNDGKCTTATWTADLPLFVGNSSTYTQASSCVTPNWPGPKSCTNFPGCVTYNRNSPKAQDIFSLSYLDSTSFQLCLIKWKVNEWHVTKYVTAGFTTAQDPTGPKVYTDVQAGATQACPQPVCSAQIDIAIVVDESKSIFDAGAWGTVQDFVKDLIGTLDIKADGSSVRAGLVYFSGLLNGNGIDCTKNWSISTNSAIGCPGYTNKGNCAFCGARWQQLTTGVISSKSDLIAKVNGNPGAQGATCISCGLDVGTKILNVFPKANTQKLIILFTDGAENCVTGRLSSQAKIAYDQGVKIIAIGAGKYDLDDLKSFSDTIYTTSPGSFSELQSLIPKIVTPLCTTLDDNCNFCSGICACKATCACPTCNDYNACTDDKCDPRLPPDGTAGVCVTTQKVCDDFDKCTQNLCNPTSGCYYTTPTVKDSSQVDTFCKRYVCGKDTGFVLTDVGKTACVQAADTCILNYCNTTQGNTQVNGINLVGSCVTINRSDPMYPQGSTIAYVDSTGQTVTYPGCGRPSIGALPCEVYGCTNGGCTVNSKACVCRKDSDCDDSDGCTRDTCDTTNNKCLHTAIDCWSVLSNGNCVTGVAPAGGASTVTGDAFYAKTGSFPVDGAGLPSPNVATRTCDALACYGGQQSTYTCFSNSNTTYSCKRQTTPCTSSACTYTSCKSLGTWNTNNQLNTDCSKTYARSCADTSLCTSDSCNTTWTGTSCLTDGTCSSNTGGNRCLNPSNATNCNDNSVCTTDSCVPASGCQYTPLPPPTSNFCFTTGCDSKTGNFSNVDTSKCVQDPLNLCNISYCDSTNQRCAFVNKANLALGTTVTYVDAYGKTQTVVGCFKAPSPSDCKTYGCNAATGQCTINGNSCGCDSSILPVDPKCDDGNGCTIDTCTAGSGVCVNTPIDCWNEQSNGGCPVNQGGLSATNATGLNNYNNQNGADNAFVLPNPGTYNCDQMACYSGIRSTYTCVSTSSSTHTCQRDKAPCTKGGCKDTICTSLGTWTNGQLNTDCSSSITPTCTSTKCSISECDVNYVFGSGNSRCIVTSNATNCDDNDACTVNQCDPVSLGCNYPPLANPFGANKTCTGYVCNSLTGWQPVDQGISKCTNLPTNKCQVTYCDKTTDTCIRLDRSNIQAGQSVTYTDSAGLVQSLSGCANPGDPLRCRIYGCDGITTGQCTVSTAACNCIDDAGCQDGDGCTVDKCDITNNVCLRTFIDCFSELSNGACTKNTAFAADVFTGINVYYGNASNPNNYTAVDANYIPSPNTGITRTCAQLGCYNGQPSNYTCFSVKEGTYSCQRIYANCSRNGCQDNICRTTGNWINGQIETDCGTIFQPFCADDNTCTSDFCNVDWKVGEPNRCLHVPINATLVCDDGNFCTEDFCDGSGTSGDICKHRLYDTSTLKKKICKNVTSVCQTVTCTVNKCIYGDVTCLPPTLCIFHICNSTTAGTCKQYPTGLYKIDKCGICGGNGLSCVPTTPGNPKKTSIAVALGVGLGVGLACAAIIIFILSKKSYDYYSALATETLGTVTTAPTYQGGEHHFDTSGYNGNNN